MKYNEKRKLKTMDGDEEDADDFINEKKKLVYYNYNNS